MAITLDGTNGIGAPGTETFGDGTALGGATNPVVSMAKGANSYVQGYIINNTNDASSSADLVAYPSNGTDSHGWVDVGITSLAYADPVYTVTGPNEAYVFGSAPSGSGKTGNLVYATDSTGTANAHQWYVGGFTQAKGAWKMQLTSTGLQLANALPIASGGTNSTATPTAGGAGYGTGTAHAYTAAGTTGQVLTSNGASAPTWATLSPAALTLISLTNISAGATTISVSIPSTYNGLYIVFSSIQDTTSTFGRLRVTFNNDSGTNYNGAYLDNATWTQITAQSYIQLKVGNSGSTAQRSIGTMTVFPCQSGYYKNTLFQTSEANPPSGSNGTTVGGCGWDSQSAITSVQFTNSSGSWAAGQIFVYGYV